MLLGDRVGEWILVVNLKQTLGLEDLGKYDLFPLNLFRRAGSWGKPKWSLNSHQIFALLHWECYRLQSTMWMKKGNRHNWGKIVRDTEEMKKYPARVPVMKGFPDLLKQYYPFSWDPTVKGRGFSSSKVRGMSTCSLGAICLLRRSWSMLSLYSSLINLPMPYILQLEIMYF